MSDTQSISGAGRAAVQAVLAHPDQAMLALDFDGTLAPIVDDPALAHVEPAALTALSRLGSLLGSIVVITGRPVRTAVRLGGFGGTDGLQSMTVLGQYGVERWDADGDRYDLPPTPNGIVQVNAELPGLLADLGLDGARIEDKGRAVAVHTRGLADPTDAFDRLAEPIRELAHRCGLTVEPGKNVWEIRAPGVDKGDAMHAIVAERGARAVIFAGDDLGDLPAFEAVEQLRADGLQGLLICSASHEEDALTEHADLVLDGPSGVAAWLHQLADKLSPGPR
ncbi:MAG: trehalose-phosphatase [Microlunatus sp.]